MITILIGVKWCLIPVLIARVHLCVCARTHTVYCTQLNMETEWLAPLRLEKTSVIRSRAPFSP